MLDATVLEVDYVRDTTLVDVRLAAPVAHTEEVRDVVVA